MNCGDTFNMTAASVGNMRPTSIRLTSCSDLPCQCVGCHPTQTGDCCPFRLSIVVLNLFVAKFLGTPPINVFRGQVKDHTIYIGKDAILKAGNVPDQEVWVGVRPEGFILNENGALHCNLSRIEVMGRDVSVVSTKEESENATIRSIISAENSVDTGSLVVSFDLKPNKVFLFHKDTQERIPYTGS